MQFSKLCEFFESVNTEKSAGKLNITRQFMKIIREYPNIFTIMRLIVPNLDRDRPAYKIKAFKISRILIKMLDLPVGSDRNVLCNACETSCNFGAVVFSVLKKYISFKSDLSVDSLNQFLDQLANRESDKNLDDLLMKLFTKSSASDSKWIIQIILKDMRLGISSKKILNCFHSDGVSFYMTNSNLRKVCEVLKNPQVKLHELDVEIFEPFRPMLSKRCDNSNFKKCFPDSKLFFIENKFDGERFQLHMNNNNFKYFSRKGFDFTEFYGESFNNGIFTPKLKHTFNENVQNVILDGEMMLWNKESKKFGSKGMELDVKKLKNDKYSPCFCVFDILLLNNNVLTNQPLMKRLELLRKTIKNQIPGTIILSEYKEATSRQSIVDALNFAVDNEEEGIIVKDSKSIYKCSDRNSGWFKMKMDYFDDVVHDLDVLVMGGNYVSSNRINSFFVGVLSNNEYLSFGKISSGLNDNQLDYLNELLKRKGIDFKLFATNTKGQLIFGREKPNVYIEPNDSCLFQIRASELVRNRDDHVKTPYTLRFPRVMAIRDDKPINECLTLNELLDLTRTNKAVIKLNKRHIELDEIIAKTKIIKQIKIDVPLMNFDKIGSFLKDKMFFVLSGTDGWHKDDIYDSIKRMGGSITYKQGNNVDIVLVGQINMKVKEMIQKQNKFDVVLVQWLQRIIEARQLLSYEPEEILSYGINFKRCLPDDLDYYGDSYTKEATKESLQQVFHSMSQRGIFLNANNTVFVGDRNKFDQFTAYFDKFQIINDATSVEIYESFLDEIEFSFYGGVICNNTNNVNLIVTKDNERKSVLVDYLRMEGKDDKIRIVSREFLY